MDLTEGHLHSPATCQSHQQCNHEIAVRVRIQTGRRSTALEQCPSLQTEEWPPQTTCRPATSDRSNQKSPCVLPGNWSLKTSCDTFFSRPQLTLVPSRETDIFRNGNRRPDVVHCLELLLGRHPINLIHHCRHLSFLPSPAIIPQFHLRIFDAEVDPSPIVKDHAPRGAFSRTAAQHLTHIARHSLFIVLLTLPSRSRVSSGGSRSRTRADDVRRTDARQPSASRRPS